MHGHWWEFGPYTGSLRGGGDHAGDRLALHQRAVRSGFTPIINSMAATGVVSLPGMMTGQIL